MVMMVLLKDACTCAMPSATVRVTFLRRAPVSFFDFAIIMPSPNQGLLADRFARALAGPGIGLGALAAQRQATTAADATEATHVHQTFDGHAHFTAQVTLDRDLGHVAPDLVRLLFAQLAYLGGRRDTGGNTDLLCRGTTDPVDVGQRDHRMLVIRDVDACNTGHPNFSA